LNKQHNQATSNMFLCKTDLKIERIFFFFFFNVFV